MKFLFVRVCIVFIAFIANVSAISAQSQPYPNKPIKIISPFATGGIADTFSRVVGQGLSESLGQPVVVENKTGGGGNIGADFVAKAPADGYTLVMGNIGSCLLYTSPSPRDS